MGSRAERWFTPPFLRKEAESPEKEIFDAALSIYRAWNWRTGGAVVDFDLTAGPGDFEKVLTSIWESSPIPLKRSEWSQVISRLEQLLGPLKEARQGHHKDSHHLDFAIARIEASTEFSRRQRGDKLIPFGYMEKTNGVNIEPTQESELEVRSVNLLEFAREAKIPTADEKSMLEWRQENRVDSDRKTAQQLFRMAAQDALVKIGQFLDDPVDLQYKILSVESPKYYYVWARTDYQTQDFVLEQNFHTESKIWTPGKTEELGIHEIEHLRRMNEWRKQIEAGKIHPFIGLTTVHGPEAAVEEGHAVTLPHLVPGLYESLSPEGKFEVDASILRCLVWGNAHIMLNSEEPPDKNKITEYVRQYMPWESEKEINRQIRWRTRDKLFQAYLYSYAVGTRIFLEIIDTLDEKQRRQLLKDLSEKAYTPAQLVDRVSELMGKNKKSKENLEHQKPALTTPSIP